MTDTRAHEGELDAGPDADPDADLDAATASLLFGLAVSEDESGDTDDSAALSDRLTLQHMPGFLIRRLDSRAAALFEEHTQQTALTTRQFGLLQIVHRAGAIKQSELSVRLQLDRSTLGEMLTRMIDRGLVRRREAADDRRTSTLELTVAGRKELFGAVRGAVAAQRAFLAPLPDYLRPVFMKCLSLLAEGEPDPTEPS